MQEIKFRAWDKVKKQWIPGAYGFHILGEVMLYGGLFSDYSVEDLDNIEIMQYTGLKDNNDREIYEGDIIYFTYNQGRLVDDEYVTRDNPEMISFEIGFVEWDDLGRGWIVWHRDRDDAEEGYVLTRDDMEEGQYFVNILESIDDIEVIGNIHENPELKGE